MRDELRIRLLVQRQTDLDVLDVCVDVELCQVEAHVDQRHVAEELLDVRNVFRQLAEDAGFGTRTAGSDDRLASLLAGVDDRTPAVLGRLVQDDEDLAVGAQFAEQPGVVERLGVGLSLEETVRRVFELVREQDATYERRDLRAGAQAHARRGVADEAREHSTTSCAFFDDKLARVGVDEERCWLVELWCRDHDGRSRLGFGRHGVLVVEGEQLRGRRTLLSDQCERRATRIEDLLLIRGDHDLPRGSSRRRSRRRNPLIFLLATAGHDQAEDHAENNQNMSHGSPSEEMGGVIVSGQSVVYATIMTRQYP